MTEKSVKAQEATSFCYCNQSCFISESAL